MRRRDRVQHRRDGRWQAARVSARAAALFLAAALVASGTVSCAGPKKLTEQSEKALAQGEVDRAYEKAVAALKKAPDSERARDALSAAANEKMGSMKERVRAVAAAGDTLAAARYCLDAGSFRRELAEYRVVPDPDPVYDREAAELRHVAARNLARDAREALNAGRPRDAYRGVEAALEMEAAYPGLDGLRSQAYEQSLHHIAILPVSNMTEAGGLGKELTDLLYRELPGRLRAPNFPFTEFIPREAVFSRISISEANSMDRRTALEIGRDLKADLVVRGRVYALTTESNNDSWHGTVYRKFAERDSSGKSVERYEEVPLDVVSRTRHVTIRFEYEVSSTDDGAVLATKEQNVTGVARVAFSSYRAKGECKDYVLVPPEMRRKDSRGTETREREWREHFGSWDLPAFLDTTRNPSRRTYRSSMRGEFHADTQARPVILAELPPTEELALVALRDAWGPVSQTLRDLER